MKITGIQKNFSEQDRPTSDQANASGNREPKAEKYPEKQSPLNIRDVSSDNNGSSDLNHNIFHNFAHLSVLPSKSVQFQSKLKVNASRDKYELEADRTAEKLFRDSSSDKPESLEDAVSGFASQTIKSHTNGNREGSGILMSGKAQSQVYRALNTTGIPLDTIDKRFMESRFAHNFDHVRIHRGAEAEKSASTLGAHAYTFGRDIVFANGAYQPGTHSGRRLLAHELTHILQQSPHIHLSPNGNSEGEQTRKTRQEVVRIPFSVRIDRVMSEEEFLVEVLRQYKGLSKEAAEEEAASWHWVGKPMKPTEEDVSRGFLVIGIRDHSQTLDPSTSEERSERRQAFRGFPEGTQERINKEADRRFWEATNYKPGKKLGESGADQVMAQAWLRYRDQVIREHQKIRNLPEDLQQAIFDQYATKILSPADYPQVLRIAEKLKQLSPAQLKDYRNQISGLTDDLDQVEDSVERYFEKIETRKEEAADYRKLVTRLYGLEELYHLVRKVESTKSLATLPSIDPMGGISDPTITHARVELHGLQKKLNKALTDNGFSSVAEFEEAMDEYVDQFAIQARNIAYDMLARLDHKLFEEKRRYESGGGAETLNQRLESTGARENFKSAWALRSQASHIGAGARRSNWQETLEKQRPFMREAAEKERTAWTQFEEATRSEPLIQEMEPYEKMGILRTSNVESVRSQMLEYIREKREAIEETRINLAEDSDLVFELDEVMKAAYKELGISQGSLHDQLIRDHMQDLAFKEAIVSIAKAVIGLAAAIVGTVVGGPVGAGAALLAFGISAEEAVSQFKEWETKSAAEEAELLSEKPGFGWVILAVVGAGLDLGAAVKAVKAMSTAVETFNKGGSLAQLANKLDELAEVDARLKSHVIRAAQAERRYQKAVEGLRIMSGRLNMAVVPGAEEFVRLVQIAYYGARKGILRFEKFLLELKAQNLIDDIDSLSGKPLQRYKEAFEKGVKRYESEAASGATRIGSRSEVAPESILDETSRARLADFDRRIAGTGGIQRITVKDPISEGRRAVIIEGEVIPGRLARKPQNVTPERPRAPEFNRSSQLFSRAEAQLSDQWERLHLWGPGFGDEAAAGIMWGPKNVNHVWQNQSIEEYIRDLAEISRRHGYRTRLKATAVSWENPTPSGWNAPQGEHFLKRVQYEITLVRPGKPPQPIRVTLDVAEPPNPNISDFSIDPPSASNLGDLF